MKSKQLAILVVVAFMGGMAGGFVSDRLPSISPAWATGFQEPRKVIEANEFRVVDERGWPLARFYHHRNSKPSVASLEFYDGKPGGTYRVQLSMDKNSLVIIDEKGNIAWSAP